MTEKLHDTLGELYRGESYGRSKPKRGEALDLEGSDLENIGDADADSVDADSVNTDDFQNAGDILMFGGSGSLIKRIDPSTSPSPIDDHLAADRTFLLPYGVVSDDTLSGPFPERVSIIGQSQGGTVLSVSNTLDIGSSRIYLDGFQLRGPGDNAAALDAIKLDGIDRSCIGYPRGIGISRYYGRGLYSTGAVYETMFGRVQFNDVDAGDSAGVVDFQTMGPAVHFANITSYASATTSGKNSTILNLNHLGELTVDTLTIGGVAGVAVEGTTGLPNKVGTVNYEPTSQPGGTPDYALKLASGTSVDYINVRSGSVSYVAEYTARSGSSTDLSVGATSGTVVNSYLNVSGDPGTIVEYNGQASEVDNTTGAALTYGAWCKGDLTKKRSTGTGYDGGSQDARI